MGTDLVCLTRFIRLLRGGSQPILAEATDGALYVVKFATNLQGPNLLFNEAAGTELYRACRLPVAEWKPLFVSDKFIDENRCCWLETAKSLVRRASGVAFGSRYLGGDGSRLFEIIPGSYIDRVKNLNDFWLAWLLDVCADHADNRQVVFREEDRAELKGIFIDHGHMFGGPGKAGAVGPPVRTSRHLEGRLYPKITKEDIPALSSIVGRLDLELLFERIQAMPDEWKTELGLRNLARCFDRLSNSCLVRDRLGAVMDSHPCSEVPTLSHVHRQNVLGWAG